MLSTVDNQRIIAEMVRRVVEGFDPHQIILFGSHARGTAGPDSDADLLVVMPLEGSRREQGVAIRIALSGGSGQRRLRGYPRGSGAIP
jgi:predicted nucleotidyltransferase